MSRIRRTDADEAPGPATGFVEIRIFAALTVLFAMAGVVYYLWSDEWAGTVLFVLSSGLTGITGSYLFLQARLEQRLLGDGPDAPSGAPAGDEDEVHLPAASAWPFELAVGLTLTFLGLVLGRFVLIGGLAVAGHAVYGWIRSSR